MNSENMFMVMVFIASPAVAFTSLDVSIWQVNGLVLWEPFDSQDASPKGLIDSLFLQSILVKGLSLVISLVDNDLPTPFPLRNGKWE